MKKSPLATEFPNMPEISGVENYTCCSGMRYKKDDIFVSYFPEGAAVAGVFTKNTVIGEPVTWCKKILKKGKASALIVNSGYANVFCGDAGEKTIKITTKVVSEKFGIDEDQVFIGSTGIIGEPVKDELLVSAVNEKLNKCDWQQATIAISTTDTFPKAAHLTAKIGDKEVNLVGIIKGSGMIEPNMATMLGYVYTDAKISANILQNCLDSVVDESYNSITVDSDTSTSDTVIAFATGAANNEEITYFNDPNLEDFKKKFFDINLELAKLVVKDGEGVSKFITVEVNGGETDKSARIIAKSIANSPLVKTAIAGKDPNWGRIAMAVGKSCEKINLGKMKIWVGDILAAENGHLSKEYSEEKASEYLKNENEALIKVDVAVGNGNATVYTSDLTDEYISINADYRS